MLGWCTYRIFKKLSRLTESWQEQDKPPGATQRVEGDPLGETERSGKVRGGPGLGLQVAGHGQIVVLTNLEFSVVLRDQRERTVELPGSCMCTSCWLVSSSYLLTWQPSCCKIRCSQQPKNMENYILGGKVVGHFFISRNAKKAHQQF